MNKESRFNGLEIRIWGLNQVNNTYSVFILKSVLFLNEISIEPYLEGEARLKKNTYVKCISFEIMDFLRTGR